MGSIILSILGLAKRQDVLDLQAGIASALAEQQRQRNATASLRAKIDRVENLRDLAIENIADEALQSIDIDDLARQVIDDVDIDDLASDALSNQIDCLDSSDIIDVDDLTTEVQDGLDLAIIAERVQLHQLVEGEIDDLIDKRVNQIIEREAPGIIGSHLKHIDWSEELTVAIEVDGAIIGTVHTAR
jgi:hypothetical protein